MTIEELKSATEAILQIGIEELQATGSVMQTFHLIAADGARTVIAVTGEITNSERGKSALGKMIRQRIEQDHLVAVIMLSDVFFAKNITPEAEKIRHEMGLNVEQAHAAGLCDKHEGVMCSLDSPIYTMMLSQEYRRVPEDSDKVELVGEPIRAENTVLGGRLAGFFAPPPGAGKTAAQ